MFKDTGQTDIGRYDTDASTNFVDTTRLGGREGERRCKYEELGIDRDPASAIERSRADLDRLYFCNNRSLARANDRRVAKFNRRLAPASDNSSKTDRPTRTKTERDAIRRRSSKRSSLMALSRCAPFLTACTRILDRTKNRSISRTLHALRPVHIDATELDAFTAVPTDL